EVDVLVSCAPHTRETVKMFDEGVFRAMKRTACFINVSRGGLVDQEALGRALKEGWIRGAGLDVTTPEPLPPEHALWDCPKPGDHASLLRGRARPPGPHRPPGGGEPPALRRRPAAAQRRRQGEGLLTVLTPAAQPPPPCGT